MEKQIVLLNGPSSSGKSTLSKALQSCIEKSTGAHYEIVSIDDHMKLREDEKIYEDDVYEISADICNTALAHLSLAPGVIIDHVITSERIFWELKEMLHGYKLLLVQVTCPLEVLLQRETARKNRHIGSAESSYTYLYPKEGYHLTVDTHQMSSEECAAKILAALQK